MAGKRTSRKSSRKSSRKGSITIHRQKYWRKPYTRKDGTKVKGAWVQASTFKRKDVGTKGVRARGAKQGPFSRQKGFKPWIQREGKLGGAGYTRKPVKTREKLLDKCVKGYGYRSCLGSIMVQLRKTTLPAAQRALWTRDKNYLKKKYGGPGSFGPRK